MHCSDFSHGCPAVNSVVGRALREWMIETAMVKTGFVKNLNFPENNENIEMIYTWTRVAKLCAEFGHNDEAIEIYTECEKYEHNKNEK